MLQSHQSTKNMYKMSAVINFTWLTSETNSRTPFGFLLTPRKLKGLSADWNTVTGGSPSASGGHSKTTNRVVCPTKMAQLKIIVINFTIAYKEVVG